MESSAISLYFSMSRRSSPDAEPQAKEYLINLIDSPGHIDFSSEVSTASRLCDGAVILVDAVEGVCSQTVTVLRQSWEEKLKPLLVINKMDRLITELKMTPNEAYVHLSKLLEQVNAVLGSFFQGERMEEDLNWRERMDQRVQATAAKEAQLSDQQTEAGELQFEERDDEDLYFAPEKNNVIFASAIDGWAFTVQQFAAIYEKKLGYKRKSLETALWGSFFYDPKSKKVLGQKHLKGRNLKPMFVQLVLEPIWQVYKATTGVDGGNPDPALLERITKSLSLTIPKHVLNSRDPRTLLTAVFSAWLPVSVAMLVSVIESLPSPRSAQAERLPEMLDDSPGGERIAAEVRDAMVDFKQAKSEPVVVYVSKMVSIPESEMPQSKRRGQLSPEEARAMAQKKRAEAARAQAAVENRGSVDDLAQALDRSTLDDRIPIAEEEEKIDPEHLVGFARIFSGTLSVGDEVYVLPPKFTPANPHHHPVPKKVTVTALYMLMGRNLESLDSVPAGVVFGIGGLEGSGILKSGTLCSQLAGAVNLAGVANMAGKPIVRVALEPVNPADLDKMIQGLKLLVHADACAEYEQFSSGEHVLLTAGELHLERCLTDLRERFARCEIQAGEPIVPYKETIVRAEEMKPPANKELGRGGVIGITSSKQVALTLKVRPLPVEVTEFLGKHAGAISNLYAKKAASSATANANEQASDDGSLDDADILESKSLSVEDFKKQLQAVLETGKGRDPFKNIIDNIAGFGPRRTGPNLLIDATKEGYLPKAFETAHTTTTLEANEKITGRHLSDKITYAFQLAMSKGPLCHEPVQGVAVFIEDVTITENDGEDSNNNNDNDVSARGSLAQLTGEVIKTAQQAIHKGFLDWSPRLMLAMYSCEIQASSKSLFLLRRVPPSSLLLSNSPTLKHTNHTPSPSTSRSPRPRLRRPHPAPRPRARRGHERGHALLHDPVAGASGRVLRLLRRPAQAHVGRRAAAAHFRGLRDPR